MSTRIEHAIEYAKRGYYVFPARRDKTPYTQNGLYAAVSNPDTVERLFCDYQDANVAISPGPSGLFILDVDNKADKNGYATLQALIDQHGELPDTITATTPSGGKHYYFRGEGPSTAGTLGTGLDTRGEGGYVLAPPSKGIGTGIYTWDGPGLDTTDPAEAPQWLVDLAYEAKRKVPTAITNEKGPNLIPNGQRNDTLTSFGGTLRNYGLDESKIYATLLTLNEIACENPLPDQEVRNVAHSVARYESGFFIPDDLDDEVKELLKTLEKPNAWASPVVLQRLHRLGKRVGVRGLVNSVIRKHSVVSDVWEAVNQYADETQGESTMMSLRDHLQNPENLVWLVDNLIVCPGLSTIAAPPKAGKSCFVRWFIYCVASGHPFFGRRVTPGNVLYYAAEEPKAVVDNEFGKIITKFGYPEKYDINVAIGAIRQSTFTERLQGEITQFRAKVVVIDPLFDAITVDDEKSYPQVKSALRDLRRVALDHGVHIMVAHHTRKASSGQGSAGDILGSQALRGATEHNFTIVGEKNNTRKFYAEQRCGDTIVDTALLYDPTTGEVRLGDVLDTAKTKKEKEHHDLELILGDILTLLAHEKRPMNYTEITDKLSTSNAKKKAHYNTVSLPVCLPKRKDLTAQTCIRLPV